MVNLNDMLKDAKRLPSIDWKLTFFGGHTQRVNPGWKVEENKHLAFELIYVMEGIEEVYIDKNYYTVSEGELIIIPPNFSHRIKAGKGSELHYFCTHFDIDDPDFATNMIKFSDVKFNNKRPFYSEIIEIIQHWILLVDANDMSDFEKKMEIQIYLSQFLIYMNKLIEQNKNKFLIKSNNSSNLHYANLISKKIRYELQTIWNSNEIVLPLSSLSINTIIEDIGINAAYGSSIFKKVYGMSPKKYCSSLIIEEAKYLLKIPSLSIEEISEKLHFNSLSTFSKQFKRWLKLSPLQYRHKYYQTDLIK